MIDAVEKIAAAVLYEGYLLWPYRRSALKNQKRWNFGGVFPAAFSETARSGDPCQMQTECLVCGNGTAGAGTALAVKVRFLQVVERRLGKRNAAGGLDFVEALQVGSERYLAWDEAREREVNTGTLRLSELTAARRFQVSIEAGSEEEVLVAPDGRDAGALVRSWRALRGQVEVASREVAPGTFRVTVRITNDTPWHGEDRDTTLKQTFLSTHTILDVVEGEAVSLTDPPEALREAAQACQNLHTWPVLAGEIGEKRYVLSSPIILPDYPQIAPESPGELFDNAEIDQLLFLNILALTDEEKQEMGATDPRARAILERTESLTMDDFMQMHGTLREWRTLREEPQPYPLFQALEAPPPQSVVVDGVEISKGSKVRLEPRAGGARLGDIWDIALAGKLAFVEAIEQDYDGELHLAVTVEDDPGRDLGEARMIGHRFYFTPDEVRPIQADGESAGNSSDKENDHES
jgi:hypothetical protein